MLRPEEGTSLTGIRWSFEQHPSSEARDVLLNGDPVAALPQPAMSLIDGSEAIEVPLTATAGRSGTLVVGADEPSAIEVAYDGVTQTVDLATGGVDAGSAEALLDVAEATTTTRRACPAADFPGATALDNACRVEAVHRIPYIAGLGWASESMTWLVVDARVKGEATMLLDGESGTALGSAPASVQRVAFADAGNGPSTVDFDFGGRIGTVSVPLR